MKQQVQLLGIENKHGFHTNAHAMTIDKDGLNNISLKTFPKMYHGYSNIHVTL